MRTYIPKDWPLLAREARDGAAENCAAALLVIIALVNASDCTVDYKKLAKASIHIQDALRHLEAAGAKATPCEL